MYGVLLMLSLPLQKRDSLRVVMKRDAKGSIYKWEELGPVMTCLIGCVDDPGEFCNEGRGKRGDPICLRAQA